MTSPSPDSGPSLRGAPALILATVFGTVPAALLFVLVLLALGAEPRVEVPYLTTLFLLWGMPLALFLGVPVALWTLRRRDAGYLRWGVAGALTGVLAGAMLVLWLLWGTALGRSIAEPWRTGPLLAAVVVAASIASALGSRLLLAAGDHLRAR